MNKNSLDSAKLSNEEKLVSRNLPKRLVHVIYFSLLLLERYNLYRKNLPKEERELLPEYFPYPLAVGLETLSIGEYNYSPVIPEQYIRDSLDSEKVEETYRQLFLHLVDHLRFVETLPDFLGEAQNATPKILSLLYSLGPQGRSDLYSVLHNIQNLQDPELLTSFLLEMDSTNQKIFADVHRLLFGYEWK